MKERIHQIFLFVKVKSNSCYTDIKLNPLINFEKNFFFPIVSRIIEKMSVEREKESFNNLSIKSKISPRSKRQRFNHLESTPAFT